ncbi:hypothetical protein KCU92_g9941, partial [Aureobasidium melanogenum]|jgi:hypothetical protein
MAPPIAGLLERKDDVKHWICEDDLTVLQVIDKLKTEHNVICQKRTLERWLRTWGFSRRNKLDKPALHDELTRLFRGPHMTDEAICNLLSASGYVVSRRYVMDTRKKLGLHKRIRPETSEQDLTKTIKDLLIREYKNDQVLKMHREELYTYLRHKYPDLNIIGRDRVYNIAREMNPQLVRRYPKGHPLYQGRPYKLTGKRLAAKLAKDAADANLDPPAGHTQDDPPAGNTQDDPAPYATTHPSPSIQGYELAQPHDTVVDRSVAVQDPQTVQGDTPASTTHQALHPTLRLESLEKENNVLHQRLQQQEAEIQYMRQAYHDLMQRFTNVPAPNSFPS